MLRPRITPCLLIHEGGLVKTVGFRDPTYVGDPVNAVKIFNEKEADELIVVDIDASRTGAEPDYKLIAELARECRMPLCYGGGVRTEDQASRIVGLGVEKVAISAAAIETPDLLGRIADKIGRQSVVAVLDVRTRKALAGTNHEVWTHNATKRTKWDAFALAEVLQTAGAGEILINSVDRDGVMKGYDIDLARRMRSALSIPMTVLGGAGSYDDIVALIKACGVIGCAAGSLFVFKGPRRAVLISYPRTDVKDEIFAQAGIQKY
jgi:cyclase